ncbi:MAG: hypothetical protein DRP97_07065, partial [Candidatus Latescibacterota bacterium]
MKRSLGISFLVVLVFLITALADTIWYGPPDDQVEIEVDGGTYNPDDYVPPPMVATKGATASVDSVTLSGMDCSQFPEICMYVDVIGSDGYPVGDLDADSFCVQQNGVDIDSFSVEQLSIDECYTSVCLVVDISGSMDWDDRLDTAKIAMHSFVDNMDPFDQVAIVPFASCIGTITPFTSNKTVLHDAIDALYANGGTALFDGIYQGVELTSPQYGSKAVIAFTDGLENRSQWCGKPPDGRYDDTFADDSTLICDLANLAGIPVYTFNLGAIQNTWYNPEAMQAFSAGTGGFWSHAPNAGDMDSVYTLIKQRLCSRYRICYTSLDTIQDGDWNTTTVCYTPDGGIQCSPCDEDSCQELASPEIVRTIPTIELSDTCQPNTNPMDICAYVTDLDTPGDDLTVYLYYRSGASGYTQAGMTLVDAGSGDSTFCATVAANEFICSTFVDYYITASDGGPAVSDPQVDPLNNPYHIDICSTNPPVADAGSDQSVTQCAPAEICWAASCSDPDGNLLSCELVGGASGATYDGNNICFNPQFTWEYEFVLKATDDCGYEDYDTVVISYTLNSPPEADAGSDQTLFLCQAEEVCWAASCTDSDGNLEQCALLGSTGVYNGSNICFTPDTSGSYTFILQALDSCSASDQDTVVINILLNSDPVCVVPNDTSIFRCVASQVCLPAYGTDVDGNFDLCQIISGPGSLVGSNWCYTPAADQTVMVTLRCTDSCGAYCESQFTVGFDINQTPAISLGNDTTIFQCTSEEYCITYTASDADAGQTSTISLVSGPGVLDTIDSTICFTPDTAGTYCFVAMIEDGCGAADEDTVYIEIQFNSPPVADAGSDQSVFQCSPTEICWVASCSDLDNNLTTCQLVSGLGTYDGTNICFTPTGTGSYEFVLQATDACGATDDDTVTIDVTMNSAPTVVAQDDTSLFLCTS